MVRCFAAARTADVNGTGAEKHNVCVDVKFLDDTFETLTIPSTSIGLHLFDSVCEIFNVKDEKEYFGLQYQDTKGVLYWLDYSKPMTSQLSLNNRDHPLMEFIVKFYVPDPAHLQGEYTRYLFSLQIKKDLARGDLECENEKKLAVLCSFIVQASFGDFTLHSGDGDYVSKTKFLPKQTRNFEELIRCEHRKHIGQTPSEADLNLLQLVRTCKLYGVKTVKTKDTDSVVLSLAVAHMGILVLQESKIINTFSWMCMRKICFKKSNFIIKFHPMEGYGYYKDKEVYLFISRNAAKSFWKRSIETYSFFRLNHTEKQRTTRSSMRIFSKGSMFRYSGRTQHQLLECDVAILTENDGNFTRTSKSSYLLVDSLKNDSLPRCTLLPGAVGRSRPSDVPLNSSDIPSFQCGDNDNNNDTSHPRTLMIGGKDERSTPTIRSATHSVIKYLLMTERTYKRDLESITLWFRQHIIKAHESEDQCFGRIGGTAGSLSEDTSKIFSSLEPIYRKHCGLLREFELCVASLEGRPVTIRNDRAMAEVINFFFKNCSDFRSLYREYFVRLPSILRSLESAMESRPHFCCAMESFEMTGVCYLPFVVHLAKPLQRLRCYSEAFTGFLKFSNDAGKANLVFLVEEFDSTMKESHEVFNYVTQAIHRFELRRDLMGIRITDSHRLLLEGSLMRVSETGELNQIMLFLLESGLVYADRLPGQSRMRFRTLGVLEFNGEVDASSVDVHPPDFCFCIRIGAETRMILSSQSRVEGQRWIHYLNGINSITDRNLPHKPLSMIAELPPGTCSSLERCSTLRCDTLPQVCWIRQVSVDFKTQGTMLLDISGYLLRKFKNGSGWQKLWVVLSNFTLFFFKTYQDAAPLAILPLLGYDVGVPNQEDCVRKQFVIKLQFKVHIYYLKAECEFAFRRWLEALHGVVYRSISNRRYLES